MKIHGEGYASGKYSSARRDLESKEEPPAPTTSTAPPTDVDTDSKPDLLSQRTSSAVEVADNCEICGYTEDEGIDGIGLGLALQPGDIGWVQCDECLKWNQLLSLGLEEDDLPEVEWKCGKCFSSV